MTHPEAEEADELFGVSTARDLVRGVIGLGVALLLVMCSGGLGHDGPRIVQVAGVVAGVMATWLITRTRPGTDRRNRLRQLVRGLGLVFLLAELVHLHDPWLESFDLLFQAPFVLAVGGLVFAHVRRGAPLRARLRVDAILAGVTLLALWSLRILLEVDPPTRLAQLTYVIAALVGVVGALILGARAPDTLRSLMPEGMHPEWRARAQGHGTVTRDDPGAWVAVLSDAEPPVRVRVEHDPVPACTTFTIPVPLGGDVEVRAHAPGSGTAAFFDDEVLDAAFSVHGGTPEAHRRLRVAVAEARAAWLRVVPTWGARIADGELRLEVAGSQPRGTWVHARGDLPASEVLDQVLADLRRVAGSLLAA